MKLMHFLETGTTNGPTVNVAMVVARTLTMSTSMFQMRKIFLTYFYLILFCKINKKQNE